MKLLENSKESTKKLFELINSAMLQHTRSTHKSQLCSYSNSEQSEKKIKKTILSTIKCKRVKHLGINVIKDIQDLCIEKL